MNNVGGGAGDLGECALVGDVAFDGRAVGGAVDGGDGVRRLGEEFFAELAVAGDEKMHGGRVERRTLNVQL